MKIQNKLTGIALLLLAAMASCNKKNAYLGYTPGTGTPTISYVSTLYKTATNADSVRVTQSYDGSGNLSNDTANLGSVNYSVPFDSVVTAGNLSNYYVIHGKNFGSATGVYFNGVQAYFNRSLGTDTTIVVAIPSNTPYLPPLATDTLTVTGLNGTAGRYYFPIIPPPPSLTGVSEYNFIAGSLDTLHGVGFASVNSVFVKGISTSASSAGVMTEAATIKYQTDTLMVVQFPSATTTLTQGNVLFAYTIAATGANDTALATSVVLNNLDNAYQILGPTNTTDPSQTWASVFQNNGSYTGWVANAWSTYASSTSVIQGIAGISFYAKFDNGGWKVGGFQFNNGPAGPSVQPITYDPSYQYLSFWVLNTGVSVAQTAYIQWGDNVFGQNKVNPITIQAGGTWQFFKIPISSLTWDTGATPWSANSSLPLQDVGFFLTAQDASGNNIGEADLYFTDVVLIK